MFYHFHGFNGISTSLLTGPSLPRDVVWLREGQNRTERCVGLPNVSTVPKRKYAIEQPQPRSLQHRIVRHVERYCGFTLVTYSYILDSDTIPGTTVLIGLQSICSNVIHSQIDLCQSKYFRTPTNQQVAWKHF